MPIVPGQSRRGKDKPGSTLKGCVLIKLAPKEELVVFDYIKTKEKVNILEGLNGFSGHLQAFENCFKHLLVEGGRSSLLPSEPEIEHGRIQVDHWSRLRILGCRYTGK